VDTCPSPTTLARDCYDKLMLWHTSSHWLGRMVALVSFASGGVLERSRIFALAFSGGKFLVGAMAAGAGRPLRCIHRAFRQSPSPGRGS
jgi:hypothetical protein